MRARLVETDDTAGAVASHVSLLGVGRSLPGSARENGAPDNTNASGPKNLTSRRQRPEKMRRRSRSRAYFVQMTTAPQRLSKPENSAESAAAPLYTSTPPTSIGRTKSLTDAGFPPQRLSLDRMTSTPSTNTLSSQPAPPNPTEILLLNTLHRFPWQWTRTPGASAIRSVMRIGFRRSMSSTVKKVPRPASSPQFFRS